MSGVLVPGVPERAYLRGDPPPAATGCIVGEPGLYLDLPADVYHADTALAPHLGRSLSASGAKVLLQSPAKYDYQRAHPKPPTDAMEFGSAIHSLILGGPQVRAVDSDSWRTKAAQAERDELRAEGRIPLLAAEYERADIMRAAVTGHPLASAILSKGQAETSAYWIDGETGITCRARPDWLRSNAIADLKSAADASPAGFSKAVANFGYALSAAHYQDGIEALTGERLPFVFIVVEKEPPHLVGVYDLDEDALRYGREQMREARAMFARCESEGLWPGLGSEIVTLSLPRWVT